jgi:hypothetical protein
MKKKKKVILVIIATVLILFLLVNKNFTLALWSIIKSKFSNPDLEYVRNSSWQHDSGLKIGDSDFLEFEPTDSVFILRNDTIFYNNMPTAIVVSTNEYLFAMKVRSIDKKEKGYYANTAEFTQ